MSNRKGFTLIEMMITLVIAAILMTVAVPSFINFISSNRLVTDTNNLISFTHLAKAEAIKRNAPVSICGGNSGKCEENWNNGYRVFLDDNLNCELDAGETVIRVSSAFSGSDKITAVGCVSFRGVGTKSGGSNKTDTPDFILCNSNLVKNNAKQIFISPTGSRRVVTVTQNGCL